MEVKLIDAFFQSPYTTASVLMGIAFLLAALLRFSYMTVSKDKVQVAADGGTLMVISSLQKEIERLNHAVQYERESCEKRLTVQDERINRMRERLAVLENLTQGKHTP